MQKFCESCDFWDFGRGIAHGGRYATPADFPRHDTVPRTGGYAYAVGVWDMSFVQGALCVSPCRTLICLMGWTQTRHIH